MKFLRSLLALTSATTFGACGSNKESVKGSTVVIDFQGFLDGVAFDGGTAKDYSLKLGSGTFIPGFEDQLIGYRKGDAVKVFVTFPEDYHAKHLAGEEVVFEVKIKKVK